MSVLLGVYIRHQCLIKDTKVHINTRMYERCQRECRSSVRAQAADAVQRPRVQLCPALQQLPWQQTRPGAHALLPQQVLAEGAQKFFGLPAQHFWPPVQAGEHDGVWALALRVPKAPTIPAASAPPSSLNACRRGISLARMRATSSKIRSIVIFPPD